MYITVLPLQLAKSSLAWNPLVLIYKNKSVSRGILNYIERFFSYNKLNQFYCL